MEGGQSERETLTPASPVHPRTRLKIALDATLATLLVALASTFLMATASFGIGYGEVKISTESHQLAAQVNRAGNIALAFFLATAGVAAWLFMKAGLSPFKLPWPIKFLGLIMAVILCSYILTMLSLRGIMLDPMVGLERIVQDWLMRIAA
jgi:hypothetical protein